MISKPSHSEVPPYYRYYLDLIPENELFEALNHSFEVTKRAFSAVPEHLESFAYEEGKWTLKQLLVHLMDTERIFSYRALRFARKDETPLPGYDENLFAENDGTERLSLSELLEEYATVRKSTMMQFKHYSAEVFEQFGDANGLHVSIKALAFMICGHELHHVKIIHERYLPKIK